MRAVILLSAMLWALALGAQPRGYSADSSRFNRPNELNEVVVTGQFEAQSAKNSVYMVRTISAEQIRKRAVTSVVQLLSSEPGIRFSNDLALGTSDISLMGTSGKG
ncbi:hypothetical protein [Arcticibacter sp. MXS-1]|uniref:hypothetical protein n=1 Tax=Arcticibacter sp. MXS-1 TaxID=3341726 RepID=UPI0035A9A2A2